MYATTNGRRPTAGAAATYSHFLRASCLTILGGTGLLAAAAASAADCEVVASGLRAPIGSVLTNQGNLLVSETGIANVPASGRISIVGPDGTRRTLLDGLPQGTNAAGGDASGPNAITMRGRTAYVAIGQGDSVIPGPLAGTTVPNPNSSSQLFSSILAIHFSAAAEKRTRGFALSAQDQLTLAGGGRVTLANSGGDRLTVELVVNFPDYVSEPLPAFAGNVRNSNPFDMLVVGDSMFVTNGGLNKLFKVDLDSGAFADLAVFDRIPNLPGAAGPPSVEAVPTGLAYSDGTVLVSLLSGGPFLPGLSRVKAVDPVTGAQADYLTGLRTSIDVLPVRDGSDTDYLALENNFAPAPPFPPTGASIKRFEAPGGSSVAVHGCAMDRPTSMSLDTRSGTMYVTELLRGTVVKVPLE